MKKHLVENLEIHDTLNPKLWDSNDKLIPDVRDKILEIVEEFKKNVQEMTDLELNPLDIYLVGSNASYNYTSHSDVDVHIVINFNTIDENSGLVQSLMNFQKSSFNSGYDIKIHGIDVELYVEDLNSTALSNGVFSVMQDQWIKKPEKIEVEEIDIDDDVDEWKEKINAALDSKSADDIGKVIDDLYILRKTSLISEGEFSRGNLIFKSIRDLGLLEDLKIYYLKTKSKELSLEHYKRESVEYTDSIKSNPIIYESDDIVITQPKWSTDIVYVYQVSDYQTPIRGTSKTGWLTAGTWKLKRDNLWHKDLVYKYSSIGARDFDEIAEITRSDSKLEKKGVLKDMKLKSKELSFENWKKSHKVTETFSAHINHNVECPVCGYDTVYIGTVSNDGALVVCDECGTEFEPSLIMNDQGKTELKLLSLETRKVNNMSKLHLTEDVNDVWFNSIEREEEAIPDAVQYGVSDKKIDRMISIHDNVVRLLKAKRSEVVFIMLSTIDDIVSPDFLGSFKPVKNIQKYNLTLKQDDKGNQLVTEPGYGTYTLYFADEDTARDILSQYEFDWDNYDDEYIPSSTYGDYSPSNPWDAPGMSKSDFI